MSGMTEEQRRRVEENKRRALALRAAKHGGATQAGLQKPVNNQSTTTSSGQAANHTVVYGQTVNRGSNNSTSVQLKQHCVQNVNQKFSNSTGISPVSCRTVAYGQKFNTLTNASISSKPNFQQHSSQSFVNNIPSQSAVRTGGNIGQTANSKPCNSFYSNSSQAKINANRTLVYNINVNSSNVISQQSLGGNAYSASANSNSSTQPSSSPNNPQKSFAGSSSTNKASLARNLHSLTYQMNARKDKKTVNVKGIFILMSRTRFKADVGYSEPLIHLFKSMKTKSYDPASKKWTFDLEEYEKLLSAVLGLGESIYIEPLPKMVTTVFDDHLLGKVQERRIPEVDLSVVDDKLTSNLLPFQRDGVNFAIAQEGRVLIADDMGLGKTIQAITVACYYRRHWPLLIIVPSSVRFAWRDQFLKWVPSVDPQEINVMVSGKDKCTSGLINILSYDMLSRQQKQLQAANFDIIIVDESHFLKTAKAVRTQAAVPLLKKASRVILLSGTPALSRPSELFTQLSVIDSTVFSNFFEFGIRYCEGKQNPWGWDFSGSCNLEELVIVLQEKLMIRRLKKDVMKQLPAKTRQMVVLDPASVKVGKVMKASHQLVDRKKGMERRGALLQYFHETATAKTKAVKEYILDQLEADHKFLVFAHHQEVLDALEEEVKHKKYKYMRIDGRTSSEKRNQNVDKFQTQDDVRIAILSITAANAGLNLTAASMVVFAELFWNPGILVQAEDRVHRIGQVDSVNVQYLVATGTADDYIWPLVQQKLDVLGKAGLSKDNFSEADTKLLKDPRQADIMKYFEESFIEDTADDWAQAESEGGASASSTNIAKTEAGSTMQQACANPLTEKGRPAQASLFSYFKPECSTTPTENNADAFSDFLNDESWDEDIPEAPWPKKPKY